MQMWVVCTLEKLFLNIFNIQKSSGRLLSIFGGGKWCIYDHEHAFSTHIKKFQTKKCVMKVHIKNSNFHNVIFDLKVTKNFF